MPSNVLLVDFGASRIKSALWSYQENKAILVRECLSPKPIFGKNGEVEINPEDYWNALEETAGEILKLYSEVDALWICSEMHGFLIGNEKPSTNYISWRDERVTKSNYFSNFEKISEDFFAESAMKLRSGLPFVTLSYFNKIQKLPNKFRLFTLVDWLLWRGGEKKPAIHSSLAAGVGFFSVQDNKWSESLIKMAGFDSNQIIFPDVVKLGKVIGTIKLAGRFVKVFGGIGDLQAAAFGAGFPKKSNLLINLGTGSQVMAKINESELSIEKRPGVMDDGFFAITHIPSGRALNVFANFFDECSVLGKGESFFWNVFSSLSVEEVLNADSNIDLSVFDAAWLYKDGGSILRIKEGKFGVRSIIASIANSWLNQYKDAIDQIDSKKLINDFVLSGGLSRRGEFILPVLEKLTNRKGSFSLLKTGEETLDGLLELSKIFENKSN
ncbi:MAG: hypothetical protein FJ368_02105 [Pelagibacterales bacterium]|nr:hypothetical protein [Pelagibacterales bacterium]